MFFSIWEYFDMVTSKNSKKKFVFISNEFMFIWAKISLFELSLSNIFKTHMQSFAWVTFDTRDPHSSRLALEIWFSCQWKTWNRCLINISCNSLDPFLFKWSFPLFKLWDLNFFCVVYQIQISLHTKIFKVQTNLMFFGLKDGCLFLILEARTSFDSIISEVARSTICNRFCNRYGWHFWI